MRFFLKIASYAFHPLFMPLLGSALYFYLTPRFVEFEYVSSQLLSIAIITLIIPIVLFFTLKTLGKVKSIYLKEVSERKYPLMIHCILLLLVTKMIFTQAYNPEVYYFFTGIIFTALSALIMVFFRVKVSLHQAGVAGLLVFLVGVSVHFKINILGLIAALLFINGWVASSRLEARAHNYAELILGFIIGGLPQFILYSMWL